MDSTTLLAGRPYSAMAHGCAFLIRESLLSEAESYLSSTLYFSKAVFHCDYYLLRLQPCCQCLLIYTNYVSAEPNDSYLETIAELEGFIEAGTSDNLILAGDFNVDLF